MDDNVITGDDIAGLFVLGYCEQCRHFEILDEYFETGICRASEITSIKTVDDTCEVFCPEEDDT